MNWGKVSGKIVKRANARGYSYNFLLVKNTRSKLTGKRERHIIENFGTIQDSQFNDLSKTVPFWRSVADTLANLANNGEIDRSCVSEVQSKFEKIVPIPVVPSEPKKVISNDIAERLKKRFPHLFSEDEKKESRFEIPLNS